MNAAIGVKPMPYPDPYDSIYDNMEPMDLWDDPNDHLQDDPVRNYPSLLAEAYANHRREDQEDLEYEATMFALEMSSFD